MSMACIRPHELYLADRQQQRGQLTNLFAHVLTFVDFHPLQLAGEATAVSRARELLRDMENEVAASRRNLQAGDVSC